MACRNSLVINSKNYKIAEVITKSSYDTSSKQLLNLLDWHNLSVRRAKKKVYLMYKCTNNHIPAYLCNLFAPRISNYDLRDSKGNLLLPKPKAGYVKRCFSYSGAYLWNNLPEDVRTANSPHELKRTFHSR